MLGEAISPDKSRDIQPQAFGEDMDVPFISMLLSSVQFDTHVTAPPGAINETPLCPSGVGPTDDHV